MHTTTTPWTIERHVYRFQTILLTGCHRRASSHPIRTHTKAAVDEDAPSKRVRRAACQILGDSEARAVRGSRAHYRSDMPHSLATSHDHAHEFVVVAEVACWRNAVSMLQTTTSQPRAVYPASLARLSPVLCVHACHLRGHHQFARPSSGRISLYMHARLIGRK